MKLQEKLISLETYNIGFNVYDGKFLINITYPENWYVLKPINKNIEYYTDSNVKGKYYYIAPVSINIDTLFDEIENTISYNNELENKIILFKTKMKELQKLFIETSLSELNTLEFKIKNKKSKKKKTNEEKTAQTKLTQKQDTTVSNKNDEEINKDEINNME